MRQLFPLVAALFLCGPALAEPVLPPEKSTILRSGAITLGPDQARHYRAFKQGETHFGAFAVAEGKRYSYFTRFFSSARAARAGALQGCAQAAGAPCKLYAVSLPKGVSLADRDAKGLSVAATKVFRGRYDRRQRTGRFGAFAITKASEYGYSYRWESPAKARAVALGHCKREVVKTVQSIGKDLANWAISSGLLECRIVDERGKGN